MKAKTYRNFDFLGPQNLSSFGIEILPKLTLGLEEFNFIDILKKHKLAFIPAFNTKFRTRVDFLELFYYDKLQRINVKYAELREVEQISNEEVGSVRKLLGDEYLRQVLENQRWLNVFGINAERSMEIWKKYYNTDSIFPKRSDELRFVLNVKYDSINFDFEQENIKKLNFARNLYF